MTAIAPIRLLVLVVSLAGVFALSAPAVATAAQPCWKAIYDDWYENGRIDRSYSKACYAAADKNIPQDLRDYSDLPGEIQSARLRDLRNDSSDDGRSLQGLNGSSPVDTRNDDDGDNEGGASGSSGNSGDGAIGSALDALGPSSADSAPIPLLVLAGLALLLVAAGAAGLLSRKLNARRADVTPSNTPDV